MTGTAAALAALFPPGVIVEVAGAADRDAPLFAPESAHVAKAIPSRVAEFRQGRAAARRALARLGHRDAAIPAGADRAPQWPAGVVGTITHTDGLCAAAVAPTTVVRSLGLDVERLRPLADGVRTSICTPDELAALGPPDAPLPRDMLVFVTKEAFYKAWYPLTGQFIGFQDVAVDLREDGTFGLVPVGGYCTAPMLDGYVGRWAVADGMVRAAAWVRSAGPSGPASSAPTSG